MKSSKTYKTLPLGEIDLADHRFRISAGDGDLSSLAASIERSGVAVPPLVISKSLVSNGQGSGYLLVSGFRRMAALKNGMAPSGTLICGCLTDEILAAELAVAENAFQRELSVGELIRAVVLLAKFMDVKTMATRSAELFNREMGLKYLKNILVLSKNLSPVGMDLLADGRLALKPAMRLLEYPKDFQPPILKILSMVKASASKQMEIITAYREITARDQKEVNAILNAADFQEILSMDTKDLGLKANKVRQYLLERRYPALEAARQRAKKELNKLKRPHIQWKLPDNFEGMSYSLALDFTNRKELGSLIKTLEEIKDHPSLEALLKR